MSKYQHLFLLLLIATIISVGNSRRCRYPCTRRRCPPVPKCPENEEFKYCGSLCQKTCLTQNDNCTKIGYNGIKCEDRCYCKENYIRLCSEDAPCRPKNECMTVKCAATTRKPCPVNEHFEECGSACQVYCATMNVECTRYTFACTNTCYCDKGYVRRCNESDICIPIDTCPKRCCPDEVPYFE